MGEKLGFDLIAGTGDGSVNLTLENVTTYQFEAHDFLTGPVRTRTPLGRILNASSQERGCAHGTITSNAQVTSDVKPPANTLTEIN
jgi:hypothetical protein